MIKKNYHSRSNYLFFIPNGFGDIVMLSHGLTLINDRKDVIIIVKSKKHEELLRELKIELPVSFINTNSFISILKFFFKFSLRNNIIIAPLVSSKKFIPIVFSFLFKSVYLPKNNINFQNIIHLNRFDQKENLHLVDYFKKLILSIFLIDLYSITNEFKYLDYRNNKLLNIIGVGLSCGSKERHKIPSPEVFAKFINNLDSTYVDCIYLFGIDSDIPLINEFIQNLNSHYTFKVLLNLSFYDLRKKISECTLFISGTTGQGHIASTTTTPLIVFSGVTNYLSSGPYTNNKFIIKHDLSCGPCYSENYLFGCGTKCMNNLYNEKNILKFINYSHKILQNGKYP